MSNHLTDMSLDDIENEMQAIADNGGDTEADHGRADDLLGETIKALVTPENEEQLRRIWNAYCSVDKWYA